jgi:heat-inducible transcriptional repressor
MEHSAKLLEELNDRSRMIFRGIVESYLDTGEPIGSRTLSRDLPIAASAATIRNVMQDLEYMGLLESPHTSAGRFPTDLGLRLFVDGLLNVTDLDPDMESTLTSSVRSNSDPIDEKLNKISAALSMISKTASLVMCPKREAPLKHIDFVSLNREQAIVVLVFADGHVENRLFKPPPGSMDSVFREAANFLNARLEGRTLSDLRTFISQDITVVRRDLDVLTQSLIEDGLASWSSEGAGYDRLIVRGRAQLIEGGYSSEELERIKELFDDLERKKDIADFLDLVETGDGVRVFIGAENKLFSLSGSSLIVSPYMNAERKIIGAVGVIGPTRINYGRIVPMVDYTAQLVAKLIADRGER